MKKRLTNLLMSLALLGAVFTPLIPVTVSAQASKEDVCKGLTGGSACSDSNTADANDDVNRIIKLVINVLSMIVGFASVIMIIVGGFKYVTSSGDSSNINSAKNTILYALVGLVIVALAQVIAQFVLTKAQ